MLFTGYALRTRCDPLKNEKVTFQQKCGPNEWCMCRIKNEARASHGSVAAPWEHKVKGTKLLEKTVFLTNTFAREKFQLSKLFFSSIVGKLNFYDMHYRCTW